VKFSAVAYKYDGTLLKFLGQTFGLVAFIPKILARFDSNFT